MKFLNNWRIDLAKIPQYVEFNQDFVEEIDCSLADIILATEDENISNESRECFRNLVAVIDRRKNELKVKYSARKGGLGRRYADVPDALYPNGRPNPDFGKYCSALIAICRKIKNTIFHYQGWRDYDQVKGHATILLDIARRNNEPLPAYEDYLMEGRFNVITELLIDFHSAEPRQSPEELALMTEDQLKEYRSARLTKKDIKWLFNKTIYGGGFDAWVKDIQTGKMKDHNGILVEKVAPREMKNQQTKHALYIAFFADTKKLINIVYANNSSLAERVCDNLPDIEANLWGRKNRVMSYFCGIIENEITFQAYKYACANGMCKKRKVSWGYDGFTIPAPPAHFDEDFHLSALNEYVREKTGFTKVTFVRKGFLNENDEPDYLVGAIEERRAIPNAVPAIANEVIIGEDIAEAPQEGGETQDERYLVWKGKFERDWCKIKNTACFMRTCNSADGKFEKIIVQTEKQLVSAYKHECYLMEQNGKTKKVCFVKEWLDDPDMRCYDDADVFPPPLVCPPNKFNLWIPFVFQDDDMDINRPDYDAEGVQMWCDHLKILCNHEQPVFDYVSCWVAHSIQKPAEKPECMITFVSDEGTGKNIFTSSLSALYGAGKKLETSAPEREVWGSFNSQMASCFLVVLSETDKRNSSGAEGKIKALITDTSMVINSKGKDQYAIISNHRLIQPTNGADPTKTHKGDRRNLIIRCSDEKKGNELYFKTIAERFSRQNTLRSIFACLKITDLSEWSFRKVPRTIYHETIIEGNRPALEIFLEHFTMNNRDAPDGEMLLYGTQMLQHFRKWKEDSGYAFDEKISEGILVKRLLTELKLPTDTITKLGRGKKGIKRRYDMVKLKKRFNIYDGAFMGQPYVTNEQGYLVENEILEEEKEDEDEEEDEEETGF